MLKKILLTSVGVLGAASTGIYYYHGFNKDYNFEQIQIPPQVYLSASSNKNAALKDHEKFSKGIKSSLTTITYTKGEGKVAVYGRMYDKSNKDTVVKLAQELPSVDVLDLPGLSTLSVELPYVSVVSVIWSYLRIYPSIYKYGLERGLPLDDVRKPLIIAVSKESANSSVMKIYAPYGIDIEELLLNEAEREQKKTDSSVKT